MWVHLILPRPLSLSAGPSDLLLENSDDFFEFEELTLGSHSTPLSWCALLICRWREAANEPAQAIRFGCLLQATHASNHGGFLAHPRAAGRARDGRNYVRISMRAGCSTLLRVGTLLLALEPRAAM